MRVTVDLRKCTKSGECYYNHPALFKVDGEGFPVVQVDPLDDEEMLIEARQAAEVCPVEAITVEE